MATKLTFIENNETKSLLKEWTTGNIVTSNRLNHIQTAITNLDTALLGTERNNTTGMTTLENMLQVTSNQVTIGNAAVITNSAATFNAALTVGGSGSGASRNLIVNGVVSANSYDGTGDTIILNKGANINGSLTVGNSGNLSVAGGATITGQTTINSLATINGTIIENNKITLAGSQATTNVGSNELVSKALLDATISNAIGALDSTQTISTNLNDGYHIINSITLTDGKLTTAFGTIEIPTVAADHKGLMTGDQFTKLSQLGIKFNRQTIINSNSELKVELNDSEELPVQNTSFTTAPTGGTIGSIATLGTIVTDVEPIITKVNSLSSTVSENGTNIGNINDTLSDAHITSLKQVRYWPPEEGDYKLRVTKENGVTVYTWVPIDDNGGEST